MLRKESIPGKSLNLSKDDALQKQVDACREKYLILARSYCSTSFKFDYCPCHVSVSFLCQTSDGLHQYHDLNCVTEG